MATEQVTTTAQNSPSDNAPIDETARENLRNLLELANSEITLFSSDEELPLNRLLLDAMLVLLESKRPDLFSHCQRVSLLCFGMGQHIGWSHRHTLTLATAGILHEIGALVRSDGIPFWSTVNTASDLESRSVVVDLLQACHAGSDLLDLLTLSHNFAYRTEQPEELPTHVLEGAACLQLADLFDSVRHMPQGSSYSAEEIVEALQAIVETPHETQAIGALEAWLKNDPADREKLDPTIFSPGSLGDDDEMMSEVRVIFMQILSRLNQLRQDYDGYFLLDSTGHFHLWNTGCVKLLGRTVREMRNKYWTNHVMGYCNEEGMAFSDAHTPLYRTLETAQTSHTRLCLQSVSEEIFQADIHAVPLLGRDRTLQGIVELIHLVSPPQVDEEGDEALFTTEWISELAREISEQAHALADDEEEDSEWDSFLAETESSLEFRHVVEPPPAEETAPDTTPASAPAEEPAAREPENEPTEDAEISPDDDAERADVSSEETAPEAVVDGEVRSAGDEAPPSPEAEVVAEVEQSPETDSTDDEVQSINEEVLSPREEEVVPEVELSPENKSADDEVRSTSDELPSPPEDEAANEIPDSEPEPESSTDDLESILYDESTLDGPSSDLTLSDMPDEDSDDNVRPKPDTPATIIDPSEVEPPPIEPPAPTPSRSKHTTTVAAAEASAPAPPKPAPARQEPRTPDVVPQTIESDAVAVAEHPGSDPDEVSQPEEWNTDVLAEPVARAEWDAFVTNLLEDRDPSETFSVLFMDIDRFGVINKEFGRQIGNDLIREIGRRLSNFCTDHELACRYGGEQFVLFSPDLTPKKALKRAELLRKLIASTKFDVLPFQKLTASIGVTEVEDGDDLNALLDRAENALQRAKRTGRNCSVAVDSKSMHDPLPEEGKTPERSNKKKLILTTSFDAFIASDMIVYKLGGFLYENQAKLLEVDKRHVSIRVGTKGLIPYWGRKEESQPVTVNLELGEDWEKAKSSKHSVTNTTIQVTIRPDGWVRKQDVFEHRANHVLRELKAHFAAK